jgi:hypothetical protein
MRDMSIREALGGNGYLQSGSPFECAELSDASLAQGLLAPLEFNSRDDQGAGALRDEEVSATIGRVP